MGISQYVLPFEECESTMVNRVGVSYGPMESRKLDREMRVNFMDLTYLIEALLDPPRPESAEASPETAQEAQRIKVT